MTDIQKRKITVMRKAGNGYRTIADELGVNRDSVRYYCKTAGLDGKADTAAADGFHFCEQCGGELRQSARGRARRFCSDECRRIWWTAHPEARTANLGAVYHITCAGCGRTFESYGNKNRKYCGHGCYISTRFGDVI